MLLGKNEFLPKIFKLCSNLSLFSNYLVLCSCFGTRFFENWVPHITWFYHFWIMWKFCHTRLRRCGFTLFKKFQLQLNFLKIKFHRFFFLVSLFAISISEFFTILEGKKKCNPILNILSLSEILESAHTLPPFLQPHHISPFLSPSVTSEPCVKSPWNPPNPKSPNPNRP